MAEEYNKTMQQAMQVGSWEMWDLLAACLIHALHLPCAQWGALDPYEYHPQRGLYFNEVSPGLICGTQPRTPHDVQVSLTNFVPPYQ